MISVDGFDDPAPDPGDPAGGLGHDDALAPDSLHDDWFDLDAGSGLDLGHDDDQDPGGATEPDGADGFDHAGTGAELVATGPDGEQIDLGPADASSTGDPDHLDSTTAVSADGTSIGVYTDLDGDGTVDQIIDVRADGSYTLYLQDQDGDWQVGQTGHVTADGHVVADPEPSTGTEHAAPAVFADGVGGPGGDATDDGPLISIPADAPAGGADYSGHAEQDATGDGTNDTVVLHGDDGSVTTATDYDGDGVADQITVVGPDGTVTVSAADSAGAWHTVATGEVTPDGGIVFRDPVGAGSGGSAGDHGTSSGAGSGDGTVQPASTGSADPASHPAADPAPAEPAPADPAGAEPTSTHPTAIDPSSTDPTSTGNDGAQTVGIVLTGADGARFELGAPDQDLDGDGVPDSVAVRTADGHLLIVSDLDRDGTPDQLIEVEPESGHVVWAQPAADGGWVQVHTGQVDADGNLVVHPGTGDTAAPGSTGTAGSTGTTGIPATDPSDTSERVAVAVDGRSFDAGPATIDTDGDGVADTVAVDGPQGSTLYYQDTDGDGVADRAWTSDAAGQVVAEYALDARSGTWTPTRQ